jgi:hypothetical protein
MSNFLNASDIKDQVSLVALLTNLGYKPSRKSGKEMMYLSMLRDSDTDPSFAVNDKLGVWYDHGAGKGGNIIDFGLAYWPALSFREVLKKIVEVSDTPVSVPLGAAEKCRKRRHAVKVPYYLVEKIMDLGNSDAITAYLESRDVWAAAQGRLKEVYYYVEDEMKFRKYFFAAGWQNESGGWEVRNKYFKGCLGIKGLTLIPGDDTRLAVFEGYLNYLSWLTTNTHATETALILNSLSLLQAGIKTGQHYPQNDLYFDHDEKGRAATLIYIEAVPGSYDKSAIYEGYNDFNDWLTGAQETALNIEEPLSQPGQNPSGLKR